MKIFKYILVLCFFLLIGCAYKVPVQVSPAANIYSSYDDKMSGKVVLVLDDSIKNYHKEVKPSSFICSAHKFPVSLGESLAISIRQTTESVFEEVIEQNSMPTKGQLENLNCQGVLYLKLKRFYPTLKFISGFWDTDADAYCDIVLEIVIKDKNSNKLMVTTVGGTGMAEGSGGGACEGGASVLSEAIYNSVRDTMERYAERISNSKKIRSCFINHFNKSMIGIKSGVQPQYIKDQLDRLKSFLFLYSQTYESKDLNKFATFFTLDATENKRPFNELLPNYQKNFEMVESFSYSIELVSYSVETSTGNIKVKGKYFSRFLYEGKLKETSGNISMELKDIGNSYQIKHLNYIPSSEK